MATLPERRGHLLKVTGAKISGSTVSAMLKRIGLHRKLGGAQLRQEYDTADEHDAREDGTLHGGLEGFEMLCRIKPKKNPNNGQIIGSTIDWETMQRLPNKPGNLAGEADDLDDDMMPDFSDLKS